MSSRGGCTKRKPLMEEIEGKGNDFGNGRVPIILNVTEAVDRISELPADIIMNILSFLTPRDIIAIRTLGKTWACSSPVLKLEPTDFIESKAVELFQSYKNKGASIRVLSLYIADPFKYSTCINNWLQFAAKNDIYVLNIIGRHFTFPTAVPTSKNLVVLSLTYCSLKDLTFTTRLHSLQELTLDEVELSNGFDSLISACDNLRKLRLKKCRILKDLHLNGIDRLEIWRGCSLENKWVSLTQSIIVHSSSVKSFVIHECCSTSSELTFRECNNLETVSLHAETLPDYCYKILLSEKFSDKLPRLKRLFLHGKHQKRKRLKIERSTLEVLHLSNVDDIQRPIIDTPELHTFKFSGKSFGPLLFKMNTGTRLKKISLHFQDPCPIEAVWFSKLGLFVRKLSQDGVLSLHITNEVSFYLQEFVAVLGWPVCILKHLKVKILHNLSLSSCKDLINGLLLRFHPETLTFTMAKDPKDQIEVIQKYFQNKNGAAKEFWKNGLKRFETELSSRVSKKRPFKDLVQIKITFQ